MLRNGWTEIPEEWEVEGLLSLEEAYDENDPSGDTLITRVSLIRLPPGTIPEAGDTAVSAIVVEQWQRKFPTNTHTLWVYGQWWPYIEQLLDEANPVE